MCRGGGEQVPRNKQINASVKKAPARRNWPQSGDLPAFPPTPTPTYLGMDLAGQQGVVRVRDAGTPRAPEAGNRGGTPGPASRPPPPPIQDQLSPWGARGGGRWAAGPGARAMAGGDGGRRRVGEAGAGGEKPAARTSGGPRRSWSARRAGGSAALRGRGRGRCGDPAAGKRPARTKRRRRGVGAGPSPGSARLAPPAAGLRRGVCARRGLRRSPSARRCGDVRRRRDRAAPRARQSRPYTDTKCLRGKLQARDAGGGRRGGDRQTHGSGW